MVAEKTGALAMLAAIVIVCCVVFIDSHLHDAGIATLAKEVSKLEERVAILEGSDTSFPIQAQRVADGDQRRLSLRKNDKYIEGEDDDGGDDDDDDDDDDDAVSDFMKDMGYECKNTPLLQIHEENLTYLYLNLIVTRIQTTTTSLTIPSEKRLVLQKRVMITAAMITLFGPSSGITMTLMI